MKRPEIRADETQRLRALHSLRVLDTPAEDHFDRITKMVCRLFNVPIALVSLVDKDRQWFKSKQGLDATETPRDISFCGHAILGEKVFVVEDATQDGRFADNPLVCGMPNIRFYAGCPLHSKKGYRLGTLCLIDSKPRTFSMQEAELLRDLAVLVEQQLNSLALATTDELTAISNRRGFFFLADQVLATCARVKTSAAVLVLDLDGFKQLNDRCGHEAGDRALQAFARRLLLACNESDVLGRLGGDEFCMLLPDTDRAGALRMVERLRQSVARENSNKTVGEAPIEFSVGVAIAKNEVRKSLDSLLAEADEDMFEDKSRRRSAADVRRSAGGELGRRAV